jgi:hypothetical protein
MQSICNLVVRVARPVVGLSLMIAAMSTVANATNVLITAPEIDPGSIGAALTLLVSGVALVSGKSRKA